MFECNDGSDVDGIKKMSKESHKFIIDNRQIKIRQLI